jgi:hypothetical protein
MVKVAGTVVYSLAGVRQLIRGFYFTRTKTNIRIEKF